MTEEEHDASPPATTFRTMERVVATAAFLFGCVVIADSLRLGASWGDDGPQAGYFPFYVGLACCVSSAVTFVGTWRAKRGADSAFVTRRQLGRVLAMMIPAALYAIAIVFTGIYVASAIFIAYFMARHGKHRIWSVAAVAIGLPAGLFLMFEIWFRTPLPKGPLEALLGLA